MYIKLWLINSILFLCMLPLSAFDNHLPSGYKSKGPSLHALIGGNVVIRPGQLLESATILIHKERIIAVGKNISIPKNAYRWQMSGNTLYPGFIEPYYIADLKKKKFNIPKHHDWPESITRFYGLRQKGDEGKRKAGYHLPFIQPELDMSEHPNLDKDKRKLFRELGFTSINIVPPDGIFRGTSALMLLNDKHPNKSIIKTRTHHHISFKAFQQEAPVMFPYSLMGSIAAIRQIFLDVTHYKDTWESYLKHSRQNKRPTWNPSLQSLQPLLKREMSVVLEPASLNMVYRSSKVAESFNLNYYMVASGSEWRWPELIDSISTIFITPLNFPTFTKLPKGDDLDYVSLNWLRIRDLAPENPSLLIKHGKKIALTTYKLNDPKTFRKQLKLAIQRGLTEKDALAALTTIPANMMGVGDEVGTLEVGKLANITIVNGNSYFNPKHKVYEVWIEGERLQDKIEPPKAVTNKNKTSPKNKKEKQDKNEKKNNKDDTLKKRIAHIPSLLRGPLLTPKNILVSQATIWTCGPKGIIENGDLLIVDGKIKAIGKNLEHPKNSFLIDAKGKHITPGLIDAHSHNMVEGSLNEPTLPSSAMVRIEDVIYAETTHIYHQLAGGLTIANLLHGSANPIGGQNAIIKLRWGSKPDDLLMQQAPKGIKFALGENVKQTHWGHEYNSRFPRSRLGVIAFFKNRFLAAQKYLDAIKASQSNEQKLPRRDLELEAIGEILTGQRWIHCHSYRQDEITAFLQVMESFKVQVGTLQHALEGYKISDKVAKHGAGASCFSDWWAYKYEVIDAIPYAGSLMREAGVLVSFNSDSPDLARRLNLEAAKAIKYGNTPEIEALKFVTINPAKQLRIDRYVGSLEIGKDGDFVIWSESPLSSTSICLQTWIDGKKYFDFEHEQKRMKSRNTERDKLIRKAQALSNDALPKSNMRDQNIKNKLQRNIPKILRSGVYSCCIEHHTLEGHQ